MSLFEGRDQINEPFPPTLVCYSLDIVLLWSMHSWDPLLLPPLENEKKIVFFLGEIITRTILTSAYNM